MVLLIDVGVFGELDISTNRVGTQAPALGGDRYQLACMCPFKMFTFEKNAVVYGSPLILTMLAMGSHTCLDHLEMKQHCHSHRWQHWSCVCFFDHIGPSPLCWLMSPKMVIKFWACNLISFQDVSFWCTIKLNNRIRHVHLKGCSTHVTKGHEKIWFRTSHDHDQQCKAMTTRIPKS
jgi:hypothetical protein